MRRPPPPPRLFDPAEHGLAAAWLGFLMVLGAITEGIGIVLLVPLLTILGDGTADGGHIAEIMARLGVPMRLDAILRSGTSRLCGPRGAGRGFAGGGGGGAAHAALEPQEELN